MRRWKLEYIDYTAVRVLTINPTDFLSMYGHGHDLYSHIKIDRFLNVSTGSTLSPSAVMPIASNDLQAPSAGEKPRERPKLRCAIDRVHQYVCWTCEVLRYSNFAGTE